MKRGLSWSRVRRLVVKVFLTILVIAGLAVLADQRSRKSEAIAIRKLISVGTRMLSGSAHPSIPPQPIVVQLSADLVQVSSIVLGHPRLAVINAKQVAEGDSIVVHIPARSIAITLRVLEISDRQVTLSDGTQTITAHLAPTELQQ